MDFSPEILELNPRLKANPISKLFFLWIIPLFRKGYKAGLKFEDLYKVLEVDDAEKLDNRLEDVWTMELKRSKETGKRPRLLNSLTNLFGMRMGFVFLFYAFEGLIIRVWQPVFLGLLIQSLDHKNSWNSYFYAGGVCLVAILRPVILHPSLFAIFHIGMQCRIALSSLIYRKSLKLSKGTEGEATVGKLVNLLSNDVNRFDQNLHLLSYLITGPVQLVIFGYFLYAEIGPACFAAIGFIILFLPIQYFVGKYSGIFRSRLAKRTDERGRMMNEIIRGIRVIKMYGWEKPFSVLINKIRKLEVTELRKRVILRGIHLAISNVAPNFVAYITFLTFVLLGNVMKSDTVFFTLISINIVVAVIIDYMPQAAAGLGEIFVAITRIEEFLLLEEQTFGTIRQCEAIKFCPEIVFHSVSARWTKDKITLDDISMKWRGSGLLMIIGSVGSGKTSFLHTLLAELPTISGQISIAGSTSYASQEPWIFEGNLRQNILFGQPFDLKRYTEIVKVCSLVEDLTQLPHGDMTIVGERGIALSGGQKARVSLARALYRKADIYLMDDPLSAVDTRVSRQLFENCIQGYLSSSLRILVTHQLQYLPQADHIVVLDQGKILAQGTYEKIVNKGINFISSVAKGDEAELAPTNGTIETKTQTSDLKMGSGFQPDDQAEKMVAGSITGRTYWEYFKTAKSPIGFILMVLSFIVSQLLLSGNDYWLSFWTNAEDGNNGFNVSGCVVAERKTCQDTYLGRNIYLFVLTGFIIGSVIFSITRSLFFYIFCTKISINLHNWVFKSLVRAPTKFFDTNSSGRVMNRFTKDIGAIDELLPPAFADTITIFLNLIGVVTLVIISNYYLSLLAILLLIVLFQMKKYFVPTSRDLKRMESLMRSPLFTHVAATLQGITTIRALKAENILIKQFDGHQNRHSAAWYLFISGRQGFGLWLEMISCAFLICVTFSFIIISTSNGGGNVGLAISAVLSLLGALQWGIRQSAETENYMTSVERALEYAKLTPEAALESTPDNKPPKDWPKGGEIRFQRVSLAYNEKPILKGLTFVIGDRQRIGIVGRTGAGKSTIIAAIFRMTEFSGDIYIDGVGIKNIGLHDLRKNLSIIPQDPVLFSGTLRYNLDPFGQFKDDELWNVIDEVELKDAVTSLEFLVADGGGNFSVGQRQLVCLARAILRQNKIIVMDEATANVDPRTDSLIQKTIRLKFDKCTIITIAHRLHSVIDCDRILVLDNGYLKEFDHPHILLQNSKGMFSFMVSQTGQSSETMLRRIAKKTFNEEQIP